MASKRVAAVDKHRCVSCGTCVKECPTGAITVRNGCYAVVQSEACVGCGKCSKECPACCIAISERSAVA